MIQNKRFRILLVDDEPDILEFMHYNLKKEGYQVYTAKNGKEAIKAAKQLNPDLMVLDIMMPEMDGIETCRQLREMDKFQKTLIVFLTAKNEDYTQIAGFDVGADDYITKPIKPRVFLSRIKALLRRLLPEPEYVTLTVGNIEIDRERYVVRKNGDDINLPRKEFELIALLASRPGKVFTRNEIMDAIWGSDIIVGDRTIDVHIRKLREKVGEDFIKTIKGIGYKFDF